MHLRHPDRAEHILAAYPGVWSHGPLPSARWPLHSIRIASHSEIGIFLQPSFHAETHTAVLPLLHLLLRNEQIYNLAKENTQFDVKGQDISHRRLPSHGLRTHTTTHVCIGQKLIWSVFASRPHTLASHIQARAQFQNIVETLRIPCGS
jgi:hypothetical protein